jgi:hypothetical protein
LGTATLINVTLNGNTAIALGGGLLNSGTAALINVTVSGNTAYYGGGIKYPGRAALIVSPQRQLGIQTRRRYLFLQRYRDAAKQPCRLQPERRQLRPGAHQQHPTSTPVQRQHLRAGRPRQPE